MRDIAAKAKVSVMTVSLALRGSGRVSTATRSRIQKLAAQMGYQPDPALQALVAYRHGRTKTSFLGSIAYINSFDVPSIVRNIPLHRNLFQGALQRGKELGFKVEEFWLNEPRLNPARISNILSARGVQGLLIGPQPKPLATLDLDWGRFTSVQLGFSLQSPRFHTVITDQFQAGVRCMRELCALGYQRIGLIIQSEQDMRTENRYSGAYLALQHLLPKALPRIPILGGKTIDETAFRAWFGRHKPDAIMGSTTVPIPFLRNMRLRIPEDVGYALSYGFKRDGLQFAHSEGRQEVAGALAVEYLSGMLLRNELGVPAMPVSLLVSPGWEPGNTVRKVGPPVLFVP